MSRRRERRNPPTSRRQGPGGAVHDPVEVLVERARRLRVRGERRSSLVLLRRACALDEWRARTYTLLGVHSAEAGYKDEALQALRQAKWLRQRAGERARAAATERLIELIEQRAV